MNELVKSQVKIMTDDGKYCSFKSMYGVAIGSMVTSEFVTERHYFAALEKLGVIVKKGSSWTAPEEIRDRMIENDLEFYKIYRRKTSLKKDDSYLYSYGFNCNDEDEFVQEVLAPVITQLDVLESMLIKADEQNEKAKDVLKAAGIPISSLNPRHAFDKEVLRWERS